MGKNQQDTTQHVITVFGILQSNATFQASLHSSPAGNTSFRSKAPSLEVCAGVGTCSTAPPKFANKSLMKNTKVCDYSPKEVSHHLILCMSSSTSFMVSGVSLKGNSLPELHFLAESGIQ